MILIPRSYCAWCDLIIESLHIAGIEDCPDCSCPLQVLEPIEPEYCWCDECWEQ